MTSFKTLINIDDNLNNILKEVEQYFSIKLNNQIIEQIFKDSEENQVSLKEYLIFEEEKKFVGKRLIITGMVEEYEPYDIWIVIKNINEKDLKHFNELIPL